MKKIFEIPVAIILFFSLGASLTFATTNIDPVDHFAKVLLDGSYIDFNCSGQGTDTTADATSSALSSSSVSQSTDVQARATDLLPFQTSDTTQSFSTTDTSVDQNAAVTSAQLTGPTSFGPPPPSAPLDLPPSWPPTDQQTSCNVVVSDYMITGSALGTTAGVITMDPIGGGVFNDAHGNLSGYAWGASTGWINFNPLGGGVTIDGNGYFHGLAWGENVGWIAFGCESIGSCELDPFRLRTSWRPGQSTVFTGPTTSMTGPSASNSAGPSNTTPSSSTNPPSVNPPQQTSPGGPSVGTVSPGGNPPATTPGNPSSPNQTNMTTPTGPGSQTNPTSPNSTTPSSSTTPPSSTAPGSSTNPNGSGSNNNGNSSGTSSSSGTQQSILTQLIDAITAGLAKLAAILNTVRGDIAFKIIALVGAAGGLLSTPTAIWRSAFSILAFKKKKPWGTVYDSVTKQPLDPAYVILKDENGKEINTSITDLDGRYGFLTDAGKFTITANKTNYIFPSARLAGRPGDELYGDLYFGGAIDVAKKGDVITRNIPMDPMTVDWNERAKQEQNLLKFYSRRDLIISRITGVLFWFGFALSAFAIVVAPSPLNIGILTLYLAVFIAKETVLKPRLEGVIADKYGNPMSFSLLRIFSASLNTEIAHKATNALGQYFALVPNGSYYVKIDKKNPDGTYTEAYTSLTFDVKNGVIDQNFAI